MKPQSEVPRLAPRHRMPPIHSSTPCQGSFVTLVGGEEHVPAALCLKKQMDDVGTSCPLHLALADQIDGTALSIGSADALERAYGRERLIRLSSLVNNLNTAGIPGRRLYEGDAGKATTTSKILLWALPPEQFPLVAFIDIDVLIMRNIDFMLTIKLPAKRPIAAVPIPAACNLQKINHFFNGGVLVFRPKLAEARGLTFVERHIPWPWKGFFPRHNLTWVEQCTPSHDVFRFARLFRGEPDAFRACRLHFQGSLSQRMFIACEKSHTDQSILNHQFAHRWVALDPAYNINARILSPFWTHEHTLACLNSSLSKPLEPDPALANCSDATVIHFVGEPKPWESDLHRPSSVGVRRVWRERCAAFGPFLQPKVKRRQNASRLVPRSSTAAP